MANANDIAKQAMASVQYGGQVLTDDQKRQQAIAEQRRQQSADYLGDIEDPMARGEGGYNADEAAGIQGKDALQGFQGQYGGINDKLSGISSQYGGVNDKYGDLSKQVGGLYDPDSVSPSADFLAHQQMSPEEQQQIVTSAGITAGKGAQAAKDATGRAVAATGGNPMALGTYRARLDRQGAGAAGDAATQARVAASGAAASRAASAEQMREAGGAAKLNQGNTVANDQAALADRQAGLLDKQAGIAGQQADVTGKQAGLESEGSARAKQVADTRLGTQQTALNYYQGQNQQADTAAQNSQNRQAQIYGAQTGGTTAAANTGVEAASKPGTFDKILGAASGALSFLEDGGGDYLSGGMDVIAGEDGPEKVVQTGGMGDGLPMSSGDSNHGMQPVKAQPFWKRMAQQASDASKQNMSAPQQAQPQRPWSPVDTYRDMGAAAGKLASKAFMADGGIITQPTRLRLDPGDAVVPLNYRPSAKARPSMAALPAARQRQPFGGIHA